ncbi:MAG: hypothetical protein ACUVWX_12595 [Kiritimatiellia bacterium]
MAEANEEEKRSKGGDMPVSGTIELLCRQIELHAGSPEKARPLDLDPLWGWNFRGNVIYALAWLFASDRPENRWHRHPVLLDAVERAGERLSERWKANRT